MQVTDKSQLKTGETYYYSEVDSPNLEHQGDGVYICSCVWRDIAEEYKKNYGFGKKKMFVLSTNSIVLFIGRNQNNKLNTYMEDNWIYNKKFFTTIEEAYKEAIVLTFKDYHPYKD